MPTPGVAPAPVIVNSAIARIRQRRIRKCVAAQDGHSLGEEILYQALWKFSAPESARSRRSPLFPLLWSRATKFLETFDPKRTFPLELRRSITRSSPLAFAVALASIVATYGLVRQPTPLEIEAANLREIANDIEKASSDPAEIALANSIREAADALDNPKLPPEEKKKKLEEVMQQMASHSEEKQGGGKEKGQGSGGGSSSAQNGKGNGKGESQGGGTSNDHPGAGSGQNQQGKGEGQNEQNGSQGKNNSIKIQQELAKAEAEVEAAGARNPGANSQPGNDQNKNQNQSEQPGNKPDEKMAGNQPNPKQPGNVPTQSAEGNRNLPQAGGNEQQAGHDQGSNQGDTHLGEFPAPTKTQRYLKPGEKGDALNIHDARYVMFRLPSAIPNGSGGTAVLDPNRARSTTPYVNAPLKETSNDAPPDERQLVPPRYRELIH